MEQGLQANFKDGSNEALAGVMKDMDSATEFLRVYADGVQKISQGPVRVGQLSALRNPSAWKDVAAFYLSGFESQRETFPFFSDRT